MNLQWQLPFDASITILEADKIGALAQQRINADWEKAAFSSQKPIITSSIVYAIFDAMREIKST